MKPHVLLFEPMLPEVEAQLDSAYCVHRLFAAHDRTALIAAIGSSVEPSLPAAVMAPATRSSMRYRGWRLSPSTASAPMRSI